MVWYELAVPVLVLAGILAVGRWALKGRSLGKAETERKSRAADES